MSPTDINRQLLDARLTELEAARQWTPGVISQLRAMIETADDYDLFRINPFLFAKEKSLDENECIDLFLHSAKHGLFEMEWDMLCAFCGHIVSSFQELSKLHPDFVCDFCGAENHVALDDYIHVGFTLSPRIRENAYLVPDSLTIEDYYLKYQFAKGVIFAGDHSLEEVGALLNRVMTYVEPQETKRFELSADPGSLQIKDLRNGATMTYALPEAAESKTTQLSIDLEQGAFLSNGAPTTPMKYDARVAPFHLEVGGELPGGTLEIAFTNRMETKSALWVMHFPPGFESDYVHFESFLSGKRLITTQTFRDLFRFETVPTTEGIDVKDLTLLFTDLKGSTALYDRSGDLKAYYLVRQHFETLGRVIADHSGAIVKTIGDAVMASFMNPVDAVKAATEVLHEIDAFNDTIVEDIELKIGIHRGPAIVVSLNDRLDYFGQTVNIAARIQDLAKPGEVLLSEDVRGYPGVEDELLGCDVASEQASVRGVGGMLEIFRATLRG